MPPPRLLLLLGAILLAPRSRAEDDTVDPLLAHMAADPHGEADVFHELSAAEMDHFVDDAPELGVDELLEKAEAFPLSTHVNVKLIGWDGRGRYGVSVDEGRLTAAFRELHSDLPATVLDAVSGEGRSLPVTDKLYFSVEHAGAKLAAALNAVVNKALVRPWAGPRGKVQPGAMPARVPRTEVDELLAADYEESALSYTVYIANLSPKALTPGEAAYSYESEHGAGGGCHISHWASPSSSHRYVYIDVSARAGRYGPRGAGAGVITPRLLPSLLNHASAEELEAVGWQWSRLPLLVQRETELLGDLVGFVWRTCKILVAPSLAKDPSTFAFEEDLTIHLKVISDHGGGEARTAWWDDLEDELGRWTRPRLLTKFLSSGCFITES